MSGTPPIPGSSLSTSQFGSPLGAFLGPAQTYDFNVTGLTGYVRGNATHEGRYIVAGSFMWVSFCWTLGNTTTPGSGAYGFDMPLAVRGDQACSAMTIDDSSSQRWSGAVWFIGNGSSGTLQRFVFSDGMSNATTASPFAMTTSDKVIMQGWLELA